MAAAEGKTLPAIAMADISIPITRHWASGSAFGGGTCLLPALAPLTKPPGARAACVPAHGPEMKALVGRGGQGTSPSRHGVAAGPSATRHLAA